MKDERPHRRIPAAAYQRATAQKAGLGFWAVSKSSGQFLRPTTGNASSHV
jgi:hypothetical protein